jgi:hypothetical protein
MEEVGGLLIKIVSELIFAVKSTNTQWMEKNIDSIYQNRQKKEMLELELKRQISIRKAEIQQELNKIELEHQSEIEKVRMKVEQEARNYENFLTELDAMKTQIMSAFNNIPPVVALLIHRHASEVLNQMWNEDNIDQRKKLEGRLLDLLSSVNDDVIMLKSSVDGKYYFPEKTVKLIKGV